MATRCNFNQATGNRSKCNAKIDVQEINQTDNNYDTAKQNTSKVHTRTSILNMKNAYLEQNKNRTGHDNNRDKSNIREKNHLGQQQLRGYIKQTANDCERVKISKNQRYIALQPLFHANDTK